VLGGLLALITAGCSSSSSSSAARSHTSATPPSSTVASSPAKSSAAFNYVGQVDALCGELQGKVLAVYGGQGHHTSPPIRVYLAERSKLAPVYRAFDAQVDAFPVSAADRAADEAFDAYRRWSDQNDRTLMAAAATGKQANFDAAFAKIVGTEGKPNPVVDALQAAGIFCNAR
jgi:hypothetical protein